MAGRHGPAHHRLSDALSPGPRSVRRPPVRHRRGEAFPRRRHIDFDDSVDAAVPPGAAPTASGRRALPQAGRNQLHRHVPGDRLPGHRDFTKAIDHVLDSGVAAITAPHTLLMRRTSHGPAHVTIRVLFITRENACAVVPRPRRVVRHLPGAACRRRRAVLPRRPPRPRRHAGLLMAEVPRWSPQLRTHRKRPDQDRWKRTPAPPTLPAPRPARPEPELSACCAISPCSPPR